MMGESKKNVPKRRFKEFENAEAWEQRKLGECCYIGDIDHHMPRSVLVGIPYVMTGDFIGDNDIDFENAKSISEEDYEQLSLKIKPEKGDILFARYASVGNVRYVENSRKFLISYSCAILKPNKDADGKYLYYYLQASIAQQQIKLEINTGSQQNIGIDSLKNNIVISVPKIDEQTQIGAFFRNLDNLITIHQCKLEKIKALKKAYLTEMFPAEGECKPKLRFAGFTDDWKQRQLGTDVADIVGGGTPSTSKSEFWNGEIDWYSPTEIGEKVYADGSEKKITELGLEKSSAKMLPAGNTVLFTSRAGIGDMAILQHSAATNQGFQSLVLKEGYDTYFIYSMGHLIKKYAEKHASGSTFLEISGRMLGQMKIKVPSIQEQNQIGNFFNTIDNLITLHQHKLEKLQNIKKAYLNEMFI